MKVSNTNNLTADYSSYNIHTRGFSDAGPEKNRVKMFDAISIESNPREVAEKTFAASVAKAVAMEVRVPVSDEKLEQLKSQIASRSYAADPSAIAARMMLIKGE